MNIRDVRFIFVIAAQRSGTTVFEQSLARSDQIQTFGEVFHEQKGESDVNFFNFIRSREQRTEWYMFPTHENKEALFNDYMSFLASQTDSRNCIIDIKQNSLHHFNGIWHEATNRPYLLDLLAKGSTSIIRIKRRNMFAQA